MPSHSIPLATPRVLSKALKWMWHSDSPFYLKPRLEWDLVKWLFAFVLACSQRKAQCAMPLIRDLTRASLRLYEELCVIPGMSFGYLQNGTLMLFETTNGLESGRRDSSSLAELGIESRLLNRDEVLEMEPAIISTIAGGIYYPEDAQILPADFVKKLAALVTMSGCDILPRTEVTGFNVAGARLTTVRTTRGDFNPGTVVVAAGIDSARLARSLSINLPIQAGKGYSFSISSSDFCPRRPLLLSESKIAITPFGEIVRFAGTLELSGMDSTLNRARLNVIFRNASRCISSKLPMALRDEWCGFRPCTPDGLPVVSRSTAIRNLVVATGHGMLGVSLGPITGKLVCQLVCGDTPDIDLSLLSLSRYT